MRNATLCQILTKQFLYCHIILVSLGCPTSRPAGGEDFRPMQRRAPLGRGGVDEADDGLAGREDAN
jgi:hypothetical protein